jgi:hypothetical protein
MHQSDVTPLDATPTHLDLAESFDPDYSLGRVVDFLGRSRARQGADEVRSLCQAAWFLERHLRRRAQAAGVTITYRDGIPTVSSPQSI